MKTNVFMNLERARGVVWQDSGKAAGELFDQGKLTRTILKDALKNSPNAEIKDAAKVLYDEKIRQIEAYLATGAPPRTFDEALSVKWPLAGANFGKPIGELDYREQITVVDLSLAMTTASDEQTRAAARLLLSRKLQVDAEKSKGKGPLKVTAPRENYLVKQREENIAKKNFMEGVDIAASIALIIACLAFEIRFAPSLFRQSSLQNLPIIIITLALCCLVIKFLLMPFVKKHVDDKYTEYDRQIAGYRRGLLGENRVTEALREALDGDSHLFRNVKLPNRKTDIDMVLVTPQGIYALEIKDWQGEYEVDGDKWLKKDKDAWKNFYPRKGGKNSKGKLSPVAQAKENAKVLNASFLKKQLGLKKLWVKPVIVPASSEMIVRETDPHNLEVWRIGEIKAKLQNRPQARQLPENEQAKIECELGKLYE